MMAVKRKTTVALVIPLVLYYLQGLAQSDPEQSTEAKPILKYTIPINSNNVPEMMVSSSIPTASPSPLPMRCAPHRIFGISWSPDRVHIAVGINSGTSVCGYSGAVQIFDISGNEPRLVRTLINATDRVRNVTYNHDGTRLAAAATTEVLVYDATDLDSAPTRLTDATGSVFNIAYNHDGTQLAAGEEKIGISPSIRIYDGINPVSGSDGFSLIRTIVSGGLYSLAYNPIGTQLAKGGTGHVQIYNVMLPSAFSFFRKLHDPIGSVRSVIYNHNGTQFATGDTQGTIRIYDGVNPISGTFQKLDDTTKQIEIITSKLSILSPPIKPEKV